MCYFLAIGAATEGWRLAVLLERELEREIDATAAASLVLLAFPRGNAVRVATRHGCSCSLMERIEQSSGGGAHDTVWLTRSCRSSVARLVQRLGTVHLYVHCRGREHQARESRLTMTIDELLVASTGLPAHVLIDVVRRPETWN